MSGNEVIQRKQSVQEFVQPVEKQVSCSKTLTIALEIILGGALTAGAIYYAHSQGIRSLYSLTAIGSAGVALTGAALAVTLYCQDGIYSLKIEIPAEGDKAKPVVDPKIVVVPPPKQVSNELTLEEKERVKLFIAQQTGCTEAIAAEIVKILPHDHQGSLRMELAKYLFERFNKETEQSYFLAEMKGTIVDSDESSFVDRLSLLKLCAWDENTLPFCKNLFKCDKERLAPLYEALEPLDYFSGFFVYLKLPLFAKEIEFDHAIKALKTCTLMLLFFAEEKGSKPASEFFNKVVQWELVEISRLASFFKQYEGFHQIQELTHIVSHDKFHEDRAPILNQFMPYIWHLIQKKATTISIVRFISVMDGYKEEIDAIPKELEKFLVPYISAGKSGSVAEICLVLKAWEPEFVTKFVDLFQNQDQPLSDNTMKVLLLFLPMLQKKDDKSLSTFAECIQNMTLGTDKSSKPTAKSLLALEANKGIAQKLTPLLKL